VSERCFGAWQPGEGNSNYYIQPKVTTFTLAAKGMDFFRGHYSYTRGMPPGNSRPSENINKCLSNCE
jgi:hypothetical protein